MTIQQFIDKMILFSGHIWNGREVPHDTDRDRVLYGDPTQECTGIVTTIYASPDVIEKAAAMGANLIVCHESLFWNHGDHTDWLENNSAFQKKKELLEKYNICVWRNHDHIHAGVRLKDGWKDGIFWGICSVLGWTEFILNKDDVLPRNLLIPEISAREMNDLIRERLHVSSPRFLGNPDAKIRRVHLPMHLQGRPSDSDLIAKMNDEDVNCVLAMELVDFTAAEYVRDAGQLGEDKCIFSIGHFNMEEAGMEYYAGYIREFIEPDVPVAFIQAGDMYRYL